MSLRDGIATHRTLAQHYEHLVATGRISGDSDQRAVVAALDRLIVAIGARRLAAKSSALGWLFAKRRESRSAPRGLYLHGGVGRGKTMLMDLFFALVPAERKRRVHFNDFMADIHDRIARHRAAARHGAAKGDDPIPPVAAAVAAEAWVLCFDEFSVTDIADAMILSRLFSALFARGVVLVATSNVAPRDLYRDGLNRALFEPFIETLERRVDVMALDGATDYRLEKLSRLPVYVTPPGPETERRMDEIWATMAAGHAEAPAELSVKGRRVAVPRAAGRAARFSFAELCGRPLGARDYLALADAYDALMVEDVPVMGDAERNEAKRFILLVDTLYDRRVRLFLSAAAEPDALYRGRIGTEAFEFARTASRLVEMQGKEWAEQGSVAAKGENF